MIAKQIKKKEIANMQLQYCTTKSIVMRVVCFFSCFNLVAPVFRFSICIQGVSVALVQFSEFQAQSTLVPRVLLLHEKVTVTRPPV